MTWRGAASLADGDRGHPPVPQRDTEPFIYMPRPPDRWIAVRVRTVRETALIVVGSAILLSQALLPFVHHEPSWALLTAGLGCFGIYVAQLADHRRRNGDNDGPV